MNYAGEKALIKWITARSIPSKYFHWTDLLTTILGPLVGLVLFCASDEVIRYFHELPWIANFGQIIFIALAIVGTSSLIIIHLLRPKRIGSLELKIDELESLLPDILGLSEGLIKDWSEKNNLTHSDRVTLYGYDTDSQSFIQLARHSSDPQFRTYGRRKYPAVGGVIEKAWRNGEAFESGWPDPIQDSDAYYKRHSDLGIVPIVSQELNMKSRWYYAKKINDRIGNDSAVLVVESTKPQAYTKGQMRNMVDQEVHLFRRAIEVASYQIPQPSIAKKAGL